MSLKAVTGETDLSSAEKAIKPIFNEVLFFVFAIPHLLGYGEHWQLEEDEGKELTDATWLLLSALPKSKRKEWEKYFATYAPIINFLMIAGVIVGKRINTTMQNIKAQKAGIAQRLRVVQQFRNQAPRQPETNENVSNQQTFDGQERDAASQAAGLLSNDIPADTSGTFNLKTKPASATNGDAA